MKPSTQRFDRLVYRLWKHRGLEPKEIAARTGRTTAVVSHALRRQRLRLAGESPYAKGRTVRAVGRS